MLYPSLSPKPKLFLLYTTTFVYTFTLKENAANLFFRRWQTSHQKPADMVISLQSVTRRSTALKKLSFLYSDTNSNFTIF